MKPENSESKKPELASITNVSDADEGRFNALLEAMASGKLEAERQTSKPAASED